MAEYDLQGFISKYLHALDVARDNTINGGICGFELEWNMLDSHFRPLLTVGSGPSQQSFVDFLRGEIIPPFFREYSQLEVYNWMIEWATRPYYHLRGAVYEGRIMEAILINSLHNAGQRFGERLFYWHGNLPIEVEVGHDSIPGSWNIAKRRYLERCVDLFGGKLATAGIHTNLSLPEPLLAWDFMHLPSYERTGGSYPPMHLDNYKNEFYIRATRLMRAFAVLFVATSASTPMQYQIRNGKPVVALTNYASVRNLTFPNPPSLDLPDLYRSYEDYLQISYDLVRRRVRIGNNNWTPVRARSFADPVERLIHVTSDQLVDLYARGLYAAGESKLVDEMAEQIEIQNLLARINIPMARLEIRTDEGGHPIELDIANLALKHLLLLRIYADKDFAMGFRYDKEDISRSRRNEEQAARKGLEAEIENPFSGKPVGLRDFLRWTLDEVIPLADALEIKPELLPLEDMASGGPTTSDIIRARLRKELGGTDEIPLELLHTLAEEHESGVMREIESIAATIATLGKESHKLGDFLQRARDSTRKDPQLPISFKPRPEAVIDLSYPDKTSEILDLSMQLVKIPSVTACSNERLDDVRRAATFIHDYCRNHGLEVEYYNDNKYPALLIGFNEHLSTPVMYSGHFDVVEPEPDNSQFEPRIEGEFLWGRGAADMKTVVATYLVWFKDALQKGEPYPPVNLLLVGNEENGENEPFGTPHVLKALKEKSGYKPDLMIVGERTGEKGDELLGEICTQNRGVMRFDIAIHGQRGHPGVLQGKNPVVITDIPDQLLVARQDIKLLLEQKLRLSSEDGWHSTIQNPFVQIGESGLYNVTPGLGVFGYEVRPIPGEDISGLYDAIKKYCEANNLDLSVPVMEAGITCNLDNLLLKILLQAFNRASKQNPILGKKLPGTSARFAPNGQGVVFGQSGIGPHSKLEKHFIPSILPYYQVMSEYGKLLLERKS